MIPTVSVIGSGMMGSGIAAMAALHGCRTFLVGRREESVRTGLEKAKACIRERIENGLSDADAEEAAARIVPTTDMPAALAQSRLVIEAITEDLPRKQELFREMDRLLPQEVPICSNTSGLSITDIAALVECHPERTMTTHFWLPAHLVPLVEVVMWEKTDPSLAQRVKDELTSWGKSPVLVKRDLPGQLANRILQAVIREAVNIVDIGLASPEDVDTAIKAGMGIRFPAYGIFEHMDVIGLELAESVQRTVLPSISGSTSTEALQRKLASGDLGAKTGRGYYDWSEKNVDEVTERRNRFIIEALKVLNTM